MNQHEYQDMLSRDSKAIHEMIRRQPFHIFGSVGCKDIPQYSPVRNINPVRTRWTGQELHSRHVPHFLRQVTRASQTPLIYFYSIEHGDYFERPHAHILLGGVANVSPQSLKNLWENMGGGRADIRLFDPMKDTGYAYKTITANHASGSGIDHEVLWDSNIVWD
jgi:hypothetical protein